MNNSGITNFNVLNTNFLYIQGIRVDFGATSAYLQGEIDAIEQQIVNINQIVNRIDFNTAPALVGDLVITEDNKNSVLLTAIQALQQSVGNVNKLDLSQLPNAPPASCIITPTTTNQALNALISTNTGDIATINGQIATINGQITTINTKIQHWSNFTYGSDSMCGVADGTGFAVATSAGAQNGNGIFVYPNTTSQTEQIVITSANDKNIRIQGGNKVGIYGGADGTMLNVNVVEIGTNNDKINIGTSHDFINYPKIQLGVDNSVLTGLASDLNLRGSIRLSSFNSLLPENAPIYSPVVVVDTSATTSNGNINKTTSDPTFSGLDVIGIGLAPITLSALTGLIAIQALAGGVTVSTGIGACAFQCGAGGFSVATGAGILNLATGAGNIEMSTLSGNISIGAGMGLGGSAGNTILNAMQDIVIDPTVETDIYKCAFVEFNDNATAPPTTANRLYQQADALYFNGAPIGGGGGSQYVLKAGDTMTGALTLPEGITSILTLNNLTTAPSPVTNRLYLLNNVLTFNGVAVGGGGGNFLPLTGGTLTGALSLNYDAGANSQLNITNTSTTLATGGAINIRNDSAGNGSIGERCGKIDFSGKDSVGNGGRTYCAIQGYINDPTTTAIDGRLSSFVASNNTLTEFQRMVSTSTGVRQVNINAQNTTIGTSALGSASTETLRVQGSTAITTTLDVPLIQNAPAIYPATSTTLVDNAVKQYRPERIYKLTDYPSPLGAPTIDGEKVIILNSGGNPVNVVDSILQSSDFPQINGASFVQILQSKYVEGTNATPPMNVITAIYNELNQRIHIFVQPDVAGVLSLTRVATVYFTNGQSLIEDFCVTTYQSSTRIYAGGQFGFIDTPAPYASTTTANNFSGQIVVSWAGNGSISNIVCNPMLSNYLSGVDQGMFGGVNGVNAYITTVINATGYSGINQPPTSGFNKYDSIIIGGNFTQIDATNIYRPLRRLAYFDWFNATGSPQNIVNQPPPITFSQVIGSTDLTAPFTIATAGNYVISADQMSYSTSDPNGKSASFGIYLFNQATSQSSLISDLSPFTINYNDSTPNKSFTSNTIYLTPQTGGNYYYIRCNTGGSDIAPLDVYVGLMDNVNNYRCCVATATLAVPIGWKAFQDADFSNPIGADNEITGGAMLSNGAMVFAYSGTTLTTGSGTFNANYAFTVQYNQPSISWGALNGDDASIQTGQNWNNTYFPINNVSGGNPVLAFGAGNAVVYSEVYLNNGFSNGNSTVGVSFRPTVNDPYIMTDALIVNSSLTFPSEQFLPQFGSQPVTNVYRDDTKYNNVYFVARGNALQTATLPWTGAPNYQPISLAGGAQIPCFSFGGYSDEVGYTGALFVTNTNVYVYKLSSAGELVIDLSGVVVRTFNDTNPSVPIVATNKLTFPTNTDGGSVTLCGDTSTNPPSWWAISQDGSLYYDNTLIGGSGAGGAVTSVTGSGSGISVSPTTGAVVISNTGVTELTAGSGIAISAQTGQVTISATPVATANTGFLQYYCPSQTLGNTNSNVGVFTPFYSTDFLPNYPRTAFGIATQFELYQLGTPASTGYIRWTGDDPITFQLNIPLCITISLVSSGARVSLPNYNGYDYSAFGLYAQIYDQTGTAIIQPQSLSFCAGIGSICTLNQPQSLDFYDYMAQFQLNGVLRKNWYMTLQFTSNAIYNHGTGAHQPANTFNATAYQTQLSLTCQYLSQPT